MPAGGVQAPDGSQTVTTYLNQYVTVTDPAGVTRKPENDGIGRMAPVVEAGTESTTYTYDILDKLTGVMQTAQSRSFVYDGLGRLTSASNPETGGIAYDYHDNGTLRTRTDERGVRTYTYDAADRPLTRSYSAALNMQSVTYLWDTLRIGSLTSVDNTTSKTTYGYFPNGQVRQTSQATVKVGSYIPAGNTTPQTADGSAGSMAAAFPSKNRAAMAGGTVDCGTTNSQYDCVGNPIRHGPQMSTAQILKYDGENRVAEVDSGAAVIAQYYYDGDGRRVRRVAGGVDTVYVYSAAGTPTGDPACGPCYLFGDHLGSTRLMAGVDGTVIKRTDYLPFGKDRPY